MAWILVIRWCQNRRKFKKPEIGNRPHQKFTNFWLELAKLQHEHRLQMCWRQSFHPLWLRTSSFHYPQRKHPKLSIWACIGYSQYFTRIFELNSIFYKFIGELFTEQFLFIIIHSYRTRNCSPIPWYPLYNSLPIFVPVDSLSIYVCSVNSASQNDRLSMFDLISRVHRLKDSKIIYYSIIHETR